MLTITTELMRELAETAARDHGDHAYWRGIALGANGWEVLVAPGSHGPLDGGAPSLPDNHPEGLATDITGDVLAMYAQEEEVGPDELGDDILQLVIDHASDDLPVTIPAEDGSLTPPAPTAAWQVITATRDDDEGETHRDLGQARWFDLDHARELVTAAGTVDRHEALWVTQGGTYVLRVVSQHVGDLPVEWVRISPRAAALLAYEAAGAKPHEFIDYEDPEFTAPEELPGPLASAYHLGRAVSHLEDLDPEEMFSATKELSDHVRTVLLSDMRRIRARAARVIVAQADGDVRQAAKECGSSVTVLRDLLSLP